MDPLYGHFVSFIMKDHSRLEGDVFYERFEAPRTVILKNAKCFGTEGRTKKKKKFRDIPPCYKLKGYILVNISDVKETDIILQKVNEAPPDFPDLARVHVHCCCSASKKPGEAS